MRVGELGERDFGRLGMGKNKLAQDMVPINYAKKDIPIVERDF
jgi:hypothetical protein